MYQEYTLGVVITLVIQVYALWIMYHGLVESLKCNAGTSRIVCYVLLALIVLFTLIGMTGTRRASRMLNNSIEIMRDFDTN